MTKHTSCSSWDWFYDWWRTIFHFKQAAVGFDLGIFQYLMAACCHNNIYLDEHKYHTSNHKMNIDEKPLHSMLCSVIPDDVVR
jgi:hypothetical protein